MRRLLTFLLAVGLCPAVAQAQGTPAEATLTVTGQGLASRAPDTASLSASVSTNDATAAGAQAENNATFAAVKAALAKAGIPAVNVRSENYDLRYVPPPAQAPGDGAMRQTQSVARAPLPVPGERYGYIVTRAVSVVGLDPARVGEAVDACASAGATDVSGISFGLRDRTAAYDAALNAAVADANRQARVLATAGHVRVLRIVHVESSSGGFPGPMAFAKAGGVGTQIAPSSVDVSASVTVTYAIAPAP